MGFVAPAMAVPTNTGEFPSTGLMQEDYTYTNAATAENMDSVYEGTVNAVAEYDIINYIVNAGQYLPADSETVITCPAGSYCPGISGNVQYNQSSDQGIQTCPTGYASSADGSSSNTQCYRTCDINNMGTNGSISSIAHATAISGNDYYGSGTDTCEPTACENGWHVKAGVNGSAIASTIGTGEGASHGYVNNAGEQKEQAAALGISDKNTWAVDYGTKGIIKGHGRCSTRPAAEDPWDWDANDGEGTYNVISGNFVSSLADETGTGQYCYCQLDGYTPSGGTMQAVLSPWVFGSDGGSASGCAIDCASSCAIIMHYTVSGYLAFRAAVFGSVTGGGSGTATCEANTITINWSNADANDISANNAGTATYGSDVRTPVKAQTIKGKTFKGWRFSKPTQTTTGN
jgi:hypothetical protein